MMRKPERGRHQRVEGARARCKRGPGQFTAPYCQWFQAQQVGGAFGLAIFTALSTSRTNGLLAAGTAPAHALTAGFVRALLVGSSARAVAPDAGHGLAAGPAAHHPLALPDACAPMGQR